jgi:hypothetical protein
MRIEAVGPDGRYWSVTLRRSAVNPKRAVAASLAAQGKRRPPLLDGFWNLVSSEWWLRGGGSSSGWLIEAISERPTPRHRTWVVAGARSTALRNARDVVERIESGRPLDDAPS